MRCYCPLLWHNIRCVCTFCRLQLLANYVIFFKWARLSVQYFDIFVYKRVCYYYSYGVYCAAFIDFCFLPLCRSLIAQVLNCDVNISRCCCLLVVAIFLADFLCVFNLRCSAGQHFIDIFICFESVCTSATVAYKLNKYDRMIKRKMINAERSLCILPILGTYSMAWKVNTKGN